MYYALLVFATILYAVSFFFNSKVEEHTYSNVNTTFLFSVITWAELFIILFVLTGGKIKITSFSLICASVHALALLMFTFTGLKCFENADLTKYSLYTMLGGMLVPFVYGIIFANESLTVGKIICTILVMSALIYDGRGKKQSKKALLYLILVFLINGSFGVITAVHQTSSNAIVGSLEYMLLQSILIVASGAIFLLYKKFRYKTLGCIKDKKAYPHMLAYGITFGAGELILLYAIKEVDASVQYPIVTGGVIIFSALISFISGTNRNKKSLIPVAISFVGLLFLLI